jgi:hypothetical protein
MQLATFSLRSFSVGGLQPSMEIFFLVFHSYIFSEIRCPNGAGFSSSKVNDLLNPYFDT